MQRKKKNFKGVKNNGMSFTQPKQRDTFLKHFKHIFANLAVYIEVGDLLFE